MREKWKRTRKQGQGYLSQSDKGLNLDMRKTDMANKKWQFIMIQGDTLLLECGVYFYLGKPIRGF